MVRINLIDPKLLADQHLIAEYNEILMLLGYARKFPEPGNAPLQYCLGKGHIVFFKDKLLYLKERHESISDEMKKRGFRPEKKISLKEFDIGLQNSWKPAKADREIIKARLIEKINKKPEFYRYCGKYYRPEFFISMTKKG
ncbi:MAG: pyrimidine dimer DNA glycosylase/endonuclease V [Candidatus Woesearchaeota archaeon]